MLNKILKIKKKPQKNNKFIYKICKKSEWMKAKKNGKFFGSSKDILDGYIHFSTKNQLKSTVKKYFIGKKNLVILKVSSISLKNLRWEKSRNSFLFPHLYSNLKTNLVKKTYNLQLKRNGFHKFPIVF